MSLSILIGTTLGTALAKFLLKNYLELKDTAGEVIGEGLLDVAQNRIEDWNTRREAVRLFEGIGDRISQQLLPLFEDAIRRDQLVVEAVVRELAEALGGRISAEFFLTHDLDTARLTNELRRLRPLPKGQFSPAEKAFYDRALQESVGYVVEIASQLPKFEPTLAAQSLQRLTHFRTQVGQILEIVQHIDAQVSAEAGDVGAKQFEADYRRSINRNLDTLELFGADLTLEARRHGLSVAYVSLNLRSQPGRGAEFELMTAEGVLDSLDPEKGRLLIRGEAGSGKTTLFRWAALQSARFGEYGDDLSTTRAHQLSSARVYRLDPDGWILPTEHDWRRRVPFLILLRNCKAGRLPTPDDFPGLIAAEIGKPPEAWVISVLRANRALLFFDGVDEVPNCHREAVRGQIRAIVEAYPGNYFLLSTRPEAIPNDWLADLRFREAQVNPMSDVDKARFIERWHDAVARQLEATGRPAADLPDLARELKEKMLENRPISLLAGNPLLCAMICALHRDRNRQLPESQAELCDALCQVLLHRRERESGLDLSEFPRPYLALTMEQKRAIVGDLAHYMVRNEESMVSRAQAEACLAGTLKDFPDHCPSDAPDVCRALVERSGMLRETKPNELDFIHNTFKEYLAAERFAADGDVGQLASHAFDETWQRVVHFAVATRTLGFATRLIDRILDPASPANPSPGIDPQRARAMLALRCRAMVLRLDDGLAHRLAETARSMFPPRTMSDAAALATGGDAAVPYLQFDKKWKVNVAAACVRALRLIGTRKAREALEGYRDDRRKSVVSELVQAINPLKLWVVREILHRGEKLPDAIASQVSDLSPLSELTGLRTLDLRGTAVDDLAALSGLSGLQELNLTGTRAANLAPLSGLSGLQRLYLGYTAVADLAPLSVLRGLQQLHCSGTRVTNLAPLSGLSGLQELGLENTMMYDLTPLSGLCGLQTLDLQNSAVTDLGPLSGLRGLQNLNLRGAAVGNLVPLSGLTGLQNLDLQATEVADLAPLTGLTGLQTLNLMNTPVVDLMPLTGLTRLRTLIIKNTGVKDATCLDHLKVKIMG
jgi:hypothetical protein